MDETQSIDTAQSSATTSSSAADGGAPFAAETAPSADASWSQQEQAQSAPALSQDQSGSTSEPSTPPAQSQAVDFERYARIAKQYGQLRNNYGQLRRQYEDLRKQYEGIDPQVVQAWRQAKQQAEQAQLPRWHVRHPEAARFRQQFQEFSRLAQLYQRAKNEEARNEIAAELERFPEDLRKDFEAYTQHRRQMYDRLLEDLSGYNSLAEFVQATVQNTIQTQQRIASATEEVNDWFDDPANAPIIEHAAPAMKEALDAGVPFPYVKAMAEMSYHLAVMRQQVAQALAAAQSSAAQQQAAKSAATITRDVAPQAPKVDPIKLAKERGIDVSSSKYVELLSELSSQGLI